MNSTKKIAGWLGVVLGMFIFAACGSTAHIQKDDTYNFSGIRSYAWVNGTQKNKGVAETRKNNNNLLDSKVRTQVDKSLQANGWTLSNRNPDVLLVYDVDVQREERNVSNPVYTQPMTRYFYNPYARRFVPVFYPSQFMGYDYGTETVREGTLTLSMIDANTDKTIWQGWATTDVNGRRMSDREIASNVKAIMKKLDKQ
jgi:hypothetical protein